jgi:hypothetical protein
MNWATSKEDTFLMLAIVKRAERMGPMKNRMTSLMDIAACHANGTPLRLADLLNAADTDFVHDITQDALDRAYRATFDPKYETLGDVIRELYATAYSKGVRDQRDNKNYHNGE